MWIGGEIKLIPPEIVPLIWFAGITITAYAFFHKFSDVIKERFRQRGISQKAVSKNADINNQFNTMLDNAPKLLATVNDEIERQRSNSVTDEQMKGLISKQGMLKFAVENKELIDMIGKPIISKFLGWVKHL